MDNAWLVNKVLELIARRRKPTRPGVNDWFKPTQSDKPSPWSSFSWAWAKPKIKLPAAWKVSASFVGPTNSMEPTIDYGDLVFHQEVGEWRRRADLSLRKALGRGFTKKDYVGQVIVYEDGLGQRIIHRCIGLTSDGRFLFRGDNNFLPDPLVSEEQFRSVVVGVFNTFDKVARGSD